MKIAETILVGLVDELCSGKYSKPWTSVQPIRPKPGMKNVLAS